MKTRSYPQEWVGLLPAESDRWVQQGLISPEQRAAILSLYPERPAEERDRTTMIVSILGSVLLGAGVILFFAANWAKLAVPFKVSLLFTAVLGAYGAGYHLQYRRGDYPRLGQSLIFLGSLLYGAAIWLIAQIFHLDSHYPNGFLFWGAGLLPLVLATASAPVLGLATGLLTIWTVMEQGPFESYNLLYPVLMVGAVLPLARRSRTALVEAGVIGGTFLWYALGTAVAVSGAPEGLIIARAMMLYGSGITLAGLSGLGDERVYLGMGGLSALGGAYLLAFHWGPAVPALATGPAFVLTGTVLLIGGALGLALFAWRRGANQVVLAGALLPALAALPMHLMGEIPRMVLANALLLAGAVGLVTLGIHRRSQLLANLGLTAFVIHVITRYFDLFFAAMDRALFFVIGGVLLLGGGWLLERNRRRWMREWGGGSHAG